MLPTPGAHRPFVVAMQEDQRAVGLVGSIIDLADSPGLRVVAEGVCDDRTQEELRAWPVGDTPHRPR
jgi:EAL domain-containing protein (putative c-di-GMP-specific phosphodiesterase class I)